MKAVPCNLEAAIYMLEELIPANIVVKVRDGKSLNEAFEPGCLHFGLGRQIRNEWGMWNPDSDLYKWFAAKGIFHADDMSGIIFTSFERRLRNEPIDLDGQIEFYKNYWKDRAEAHGATGRGSEGLLAWIRKRWKEAWK